MGGDHAPAEILKGVLLARETLDFTPVLVGNSDAVKSCAKENALDVSGIGILHAENVIRMEDPPMSVRSVPSSSLRVGLTALADKKGAAFVSAGNTGALQMGANLYVHRIPGVTRPAIGAILPMASPTLLLDCGANATFSPELLCQYALTGSIYMKKVHGIKKPRVGLLNIGSEPYKGTPDHAQAYVLLSELSGIVFVGNVEPNLLSKDLCDVLVCDGFSGNILLKTLEGIGTYIFDLLGSCAADRGKDLEGAQNELKKRFDPSEYGGAPLIGIAAPVIKAHGNSNARAIANAIAQAIRYARGKVTKEIERGLAGVRTPEKK